MKPLLTGALGIACCFVAVISSAAEAGYPPPFDTVPPGYHVESRPQWGYIVISGIDVAVPYAAGLVVAAGAHFDNHSGWLFVPALGPWLTLFTRRKSQQTDGSDQVFGRDDFATAALVVDGVCQVVGAAGLIVFSTSAPKRLVRDSAVEARIAPYAVPGGAGVGLAGRF